MSDLVTLSELKTFLGDVPAADDTLLTDLLEHAESLFEGQCGRADAPFVASSSHTEYRDGTGTAELYLGFPISTLTSVKLGFDPASPDETLDVSNKLIVGFAPGARRLARVDGGTFGLAGAPNYVQVVYTSSNELPEDAQLAIKRVVAAIYRQRGSEDSTRESISGAYSRDLVEIAAESDSVWIAAVAAHRRMVLA